ncbi:BA14K family protein [Rhodopseudomonas parapalustris]
MSKSTQPSGGKPRKFLTRALASVALLTMYGLGMVATTGAAMTLASTPAHAQRGRGRGWGRGRGRGRGWGGPGPGAAIGIGIGAAIVGGAIAASQAEAARQQDYCARRFRSYNPATGTYIAKGGREVPCP